MTRGLLASPLQQCARYTFLSLGLVSLPVCSSPWQINPRAGISSILGSPLQPRLHFHTLMSWALRPFMQRLPWHTLLDPKCLSNCRQRIHNLFTLASFMTPKPTPHRRPAKFVDNTAKSGCHLGMDSASLQTTLVAAFVCSCFLGVKAL